MKKILQIVVFLSVCCLSVFPQNLAQKAEENPLDLAFFMIKSHKSAEFYDDELWNVSLNYFRANRKNDALHAIDFMEFNNRKTTVLLIIAYWLIRDKKYKEADFYLTKASDVNRKNVYGIDIKDSREIAGKWIAISNEEKALREVEFVGEKSEKASVCQAVAEEFFKVGNFDKAAKYLLKARELIRNEEASEFSVFTKAQIAKTFSLIKDNQTAEELISEVEKDYENVEYSKSYPKKDEIYELISETYLKIGKLDKGFELIKAKIDSNTPEGLIKIAEADIKAGLNSEAKEALQKAADFEENTYSQFQAVNLYLQINEDISAVELAKKMKPDYDRFLALTLIADKFIADGRKSEAVNLLNPAVEQILQADESGYDYDDYSEKERQLAIIFDSFNELKRFDLASNMVNFPFKTDFQSLIYTTFAYKYREKLPKNTSLDYLSRSLQVLRKNKRKITGREVDRYPTVRFWLKTAGILSEFKEKEKSLQVFKEVLGMIFSEEYISESELIDLLSETGLEFENSKITADKEMKTLLIKIRNKWHDDECFDDCDSV